MTKIQGDFAGAEAAHQAKTTLIQNGIAENRIRVWNIIPDSGSQQGDGEATTTGAIAGGLLGGGGGLVAGAALGSMLDNAYEPESHLPAPSGVRVVVDVANDQERLESLLHNANAANVHVLEGD